MAKSIDLSGQVFGKLTVKSMTKVSNHNGMFCICICECGQECIKSSRNLRSKKCKSCGCSNNQSDILKFKRENPNATQEEILQFRIKSHIKEENGCWIWQATIGKDGYGRIEINKTGMNAHRASYIAFKGKIEGNQCVCHNCPGGENRACVNPDHMFLGSHKENTHDMVKKGRSNWETCRKFPIGTREKVAELRKTGMIYREIADKLGLTLHQVTSLWQNYNRKKLAPKQNL